MSRATSEKKAASCRFNGARGTAIRMGHTPERRRQQAINAAKVRWANAKEKAAREAARKARLGS